MVTIAEFIRAYTAALREHNAAVLIGAGLSIPAGLVDWKGLMRSIASEVGLDVEKEHDLVTLAQYHINEKGGRHGINQALVNEFSTRARVTENHRILTRLPIDTYWTTNYDHLIEDSLQEAGKKPDIKTTHDSLATTLYARDAVVYKMHGDVSDAANAVVTRDDYELYGTSRRGQLFSTALQGDLVSKTFLFLGFSFSDPNLDHTLSRIRVLLGTNRRTHYCLMRKVQRKDFNSPAAFRYASTKQDLQVRDLQRYGIMAVLLDSFDHYTEALKLLEKTFRSSQVFISGSAMTYHPWTEARATSFLTLLGRRLAERGMNVITGFGSGVGPHVINGVLDHLEKSGTKNLNDKLTLRPFPHQITDPVKRKRRWTEYRENMITTAGIAIFVFGNKAVASGTVSADGMMEEFEIAKESGLLIIPVGSTGYVAQELHAKILKDLSTYYQPVSGIKSAFMDLGKPGTPQKTIDRILKLMDVAKPDC